MGVVDEDDPILSAVAEALIGCKKGLSISDGTPDCLFLGDESHVIYQGRR